jgi:hypothetical protein
MRPMFLRFQQPTPEALGNSARLGVLIVSTLGADFILWQVPSFGVVGVGTLLGQVSITG